MRRRCDGDATDMRSRDETKMRWGCNRNATGMRQRYDRNAVQGCNEYVMGMRQGRDGDVRDATRMRREFGDAGLKITNHSSSKVAKAIGSFN